MSGDRELVDRFAIEEILLGYLLPPELVTAIADDVNAAITPLRTANAELSRACNMALHALRSYQHGNTAPALAEGVADELEAAVAKARGHDV